MAFLEYSEYRRYGRLLPPMGLNGPGCKSGRIIETWAFISLNLAMYVVTFSLFARASAISSILSELFSVQAARNACKRSNVLLTSGLPALSASRAHARARIIKIEP